MKLLRSIFVGFAVSVSVLFGQPYEAAFLAWRGQWRGDDECFNSKSGHEEAAAIIAHRDFWKQYVEPYLGLGAAESAAVRDGVVVRPVASRNVENDEVIEVKLTIGKGGERAFDLIVSGFERYLRSFAHAKIAGARAYLQEQLELSKTGHHTDRSAIEGKIAELEREAVDPMKLPSRKVIVSVQKP